MDAVGLLDVHWACGYQGDEVAFIDDDTVAFMCGSHVTFRNVATGDERIFSGVAAGVACLAVGAARRVFACAETGLAPDVRVYEYPSLRLRATLRDGARLAYRSLAFSYSDHLVALSDVPDLRLTLWDWSRQVALCTETLSGSQVPRGVTFNPINWREMCGFAESSIVVWHVQQAESKCTLVSGVYRTPERGAAAGTVRPASAGVAARVRQPQQAIPRAAIAGLVGPLADRFEEEFCSAARMRVTCCCWSHDDRLYCGCADGQLLLVDVEQQCVEVLLGCDDAGEGSCACVALSKQGVLLGGNDGTIRLLDAAGTRKRAPQTVASVGGPVTSLSVGPTCETVAAGCRWGTVRVLDTAKWQPCASYFEEQRVGAVACAWLDSGHCVSVCGDGTLQTWNAASGREIGRVDLGVACAVVACSPLLPLAAVGTATGCVALVDVSRREAPRVISSRYLFRDAAVATLHFSCCGALLLCAAEEESAAVYVLSGKPGKGFSVLGWLDAGGRVEAAATVAGGDAGTARVMLLVNASGDAAAEGGDRLLRVDLPATALERAPVQHHVDALGRLCDDKLGTSVFTLDGRHHGLACAADGSAYTLSAASRNVIKFLVPEGGGGNDALAPVMEVSAHELAGGQVALSLHERWLYTAGRDGRLIARMVDAMERAVYNAPHDPSLGGVRSLAVSADARHVLTLGYDGAIVCSRWNYTGDGEALAAAAAAADAHASRLRPSRELEMPALTALADAVVAGGDCTWVETRQREAAEREEVGVADEKRAICEQAAAIRAELHAMLADNDRLPDTERLPRHEFELDLEEEARRRGDEERAIACMRAEYEMSNLARAYVREVIKNECWDEMEVKGRAIRSFHAAVEVSNYPLRARTARELAELSGVTRTRKIEISEAAASRDIVSDPRGQQVSMLDDDDAYDTDEGERSEGAALLGSFGAERGGGSELLHSQFALNTSEQKQDQIVLLRDAIHRIKQRFNARFDATFKHKESEVVKVQEKNRRIRAIQDDLGYTDALWEPAVHVAEKPETMLVVSDYELAAVADGYVSAAMRRQIEADDELRARKARQKGATARERALVDMMGGVLEVRLEDELKKDVPQPAFIAAKPDAADWTEEEQRASRDYEARVRERQEEREKYRKQLDAELKKLATGIADDAAAFDDAVAELFREKLAAEMAVHQEELKIVRLAASLVETQQIAAWETRLGRHLVERKRGKQMAQAQALDARQQTDTLREAYDIHVAEDKVLDKAFKRDFADLPIFHQEQLYKLYRRRPKGLRNPAPPRSRSAEKPSAASGALSKRPSTAQLQRGHQEALAAAVDELDAIANMPEGVEIATWERLCAARRAKIDSEQTLRQRALALADLAALLQRRQEADERAQREIEDTVRALSSLAERRSRLACDLRVQLLLKQGQVEVVAAGPLAPDYAGSVLIHRSAVDELNKVIRSFAAAKIASMVESKDFRVGIARLEWEHQRTSMLVDDAHARIRDIQTLHVSREVQRHLAADGDDANVSVRQAHELRTLERTLVAQDGERSRAVAARRRALARLKMAAEKKRAENESLEVAAAELNVGVNERRNVGRTRVGDGPTRRQRERRYRDIVRRHRTAALARAQGAEITFLRREVERLRMRTFPALKAVYD